MNTKNDVLIDAQFIYNTCVDIRDAKKLMGSAFWRSQPREYRTAVWNKLINLCENKGYFEEVA